MYRRDQPVWSTPKPRLSSSGLHHNGFGKCVFGAQEIASCVIYVKDRAALLQPRQPSGKVLANSLVVSCGFCISANNELGQGELRRLGFGELRDPGGKEYGL
jgi:hypothetical protein